MTGETDLRRLLGALAPRLDPDPYVFAVIARADPLPAGIAPFATIAEDEGLTIVVAAAAWRDTGLGASPDHARLVMMVHSALEAVGMTAAIAAILAARGISANVIAAYHHDHVFVPWERRHEALAAIEELAAKAGAAD